MIMNTSLQIQHQQQQQNHQQHLQQQQQQQQQQDDQKINYFGISGLQEEVRNRPFVCNICNATYKTRTHLRRHMFVHMTNRPYPCPDCGKGFNRKEHLNKHQDAVHSGTKYECGFCGKEISRKDHLNRHIKNMHSSLCLNGSLNGNSIGVNGEIKMEPHHQQSITLPHQNNMIKVNLPFKQKTTQINFLTANGIQVQQQQNNIKMKPNKQTTSRTKQQLQYQQVIQSMHPQQQQQQQQSNHQIKTEMNVDNSLMEKKLLFQVYNCNECSATFTTEKDYNTHIRTHKPQPYKCLECPRAYTRREKLTEHIRCFHEGQKFTCDYCNKSLSRKDHVLRHVRSVHPEVLASRFVSMAEDMDAQSRLLNYPTTSSSSSTSTTTNTQQQQASAAALGEMNILLRSVCHICLKVFGTSYHLSRHMESCHNGDLRPYSCNSCSKQFKRKDHLSKHQKSHCPSTKSLKMTEMDSTEIESNVMNSLQILMSCPDEDIHNDLMSSSPTNNNNNNNGSKCNNTNSGGNTSIKIDELLHVDPSLNSTNLSNLMSCNYCQKEFTSRERFIIHLQDHQHNDGTTSMV